MAAPGLQATIVGPTAGAAIPYGATISIDVTGHSPGARNISGYLTLDGAWAGSIPPTPPRANGTTVHVRLEAASFAAGPHLLSAQVFTDKDGPTEAPAIEIVLDAPPTFSASAAYDHDARELVVDIEVQDEAPVRASLTSIFRTANATIDGAGTLRLPLALVPGSYHASVNVTDRVNQTTRRDLTYTVIDRPGTATVETRFTATATLEIRASLRDPDGPVRSATARLHPSEPRHVLSNVNGTWQADISITQAPGDYTGVLTFVDNATGTTNVTFPYTITGTKLVVLEREVVTEIGAYADAAALPLPALFNGTIEICVDCDENGAPGPSRPGVFVRLDIRSQNATSPTPTCQATGGLQRCTFSTRTGADVLDLAWLQGIERRVTVRVSGWQA